MNIEILMKSLNSVSVLNENKRIKSIIFILINLSTFFSNLHAFVPFLWT